jgi:hypothetical protein
VSGTEHEEWDAILPQWHHTVLGAGPSAGLEPYCKRYCRYLEHGGALPITLSSQTDASANARIADDRHDELNMSREATAGAAAKSQTEELADFHQRQVTDLSSA